MSINFTFQNWYNNYDNVVVQSVVAEVIDHSEAITGKFSKTANAGNFVIIAA